MSVLPIGMGSSVSTSSYSIARSVRFKVGSTSHFHKTYSTAPTDLKKQTFSFWFKTSNSGETTYPTILSVNRSTGDYSECYIDASGGTYTIGFHINTTNYVRTAASLRDHTAWYHIVYVLDTTQATASDRIVIYINGQRASVGASNYPAQNSTTSYCFTQYKHIICGSETSGPGSGITSGRRVSGYLAEFHGIDGQALTPADFGQANAHGVWVPKAYTGTYGNNGFYLDFSTGSSATTLGYDAYGSNDWTPSGISTTPGVDYDWMTDTPTNNYCTLSPLSNPNVSPLFTLTQGNLEFSHSASAGQAHRMSMIGTIGVTTGKWYFEYITGSTPNDLIGISSEILVGSALGTKYVTYSNELSGSFVVSAGVSTSGTPADYTTNDIIGVAFDCDAQTLTWYKNNVSQGTASNIGSGTWFPIRSPASGATGGQGYFNFGQRGFNYTPPTNYKALCTSNLPAVAIPRPRDYFDAKTYVGSGATNNVTGLLFQPDLVWIKNRPNTGGYPHVIQDVVRGVQKQLRSDSTNAETSYTDQVTSFNADGFTLYAANSWVNQSPDNYVSWNWKANGAVSANNNTVGTITSTVSANPMSGFSIVGYSGNATAGATVGHGCKVNNVATAPSFIILHERTTGGQWWQVYHSAISTNYYLALNTTNYPGDGGILSSSAWWNSTAPSSTVFTLGSNAQNNRSGSDFIAYCWAEVPGYSKFGSYTGNGSSDGPYVYCGFRPRYVLMKSYSSATHWILIDTARDTYNMAGYKLAPNDSSAENFASIGGVTENSLDVTASGFKLRSINSQNNNNGSTYIYAAFAEYPFGGFNVAPVPAR